MSEVDTMLEAQQVIEDAEKLAQSTFREPDYRGGDNPQSKLIRNGKKPLPERLPAYRTLTGTLVMLPTATYYQSLNKKFPDGTRVFVTKAEQCARPPVPIAESCDICQIRRVTKVFYSIYDYEGHMDAFHPREWASKMRTQDRAERREELQLLRRLAEGRAEGRVAAVPQAPKRKWTPEQRKAASDRAKVRIAEGVN